MLSRRMGYNDKKKAIMIKNKEEYSKEQSNLTEQNDWIWNDCFVYSMFEEDKLKRKVLESRISVLNSL